MSGPLVVPAGFDVAEYADEFATARLSSTLKRISYRIDRNLRRLWQMSLSFNRDFLTCAVDKGRVDVAEYVNNIFATARMCRLSVEENVRAHSSKPLSLELAKGRLLVIINSITSSASRASRPRRALHDKYSA